MSTNPQGGYERTDAHIPSIWKFIAGLFVLVGISLLLMLLMFRFLYRTEQAEMATPTPMEAKRVLPPAPRLQINGAVDLDTMRRKEDETLHSYGWVDRNAGVVRIPVERAIELLSERGMPAARKKQ